MSKLSSMTGLRSPGKRPVEWITPSKSLNQAGSPMLTRFEDFELDLDLGELRRKGSLVKLERIPMQLLCLLVSGRGEVLTRARIIEALWGKDTSVETDNGLNSAIRKVRAAPRPRPEEPRLISTVPGPASRFTGVLLEEPS